MSKSKDVFDVMQHKLVVIKMELLTLLYTKIVLLLVAALNLVFEVP